MIVYYAKPIISKLLNLNVLTVTTPNVY